MTLTVANILTVSRIFLAPVFMVFMVMNTPTSIAIAVVVFAIAALTDWLDGASARAWDQVTEQGRYLDPLADKVLTTTAFVTFYLQDLMPLWMVLIIVARDFGITSLRSVVEAKGLALVTSWHAKVKTFLQMIVIVYILLLQFAASPPLELPVVVTASAADALRSWYTLAPLLALTAITVWTAAEYLYRYRAVFTFRLTIHEFVATVAGVGFLPLAPGTWGSLVVAMLGLVSIPDNDTAAGLFMMLTVICVAGGLWAIPRVQIRHGSDPSLVVIDEAAGMALVLVSPLVRSEPVWLLIGFLVFRLFDIVKPWPANIFNQRHEPWSVIIDDLIAAVYTIALVHVVHAAIQPILLFMALQ